MTPLLILDIVMKSFAIVLLAFAGQACWRQASASQRCLLWLAAFAGLLALPLTLLIKPCWTPVTTTQSIPRVASTSQILTALQVAGIPESSAPLEPGKQAWWQRLSLVEVTGLCWLAGVLVVLGHRALGSWQLRLLRAESSLCEDPQLGRQVADLARSLGIRRPVKILTSNAVAVPVTWGVCRPVLLLPRQALSWNEEATRAALMHELGHIRHLDAASRWLATLACSVQWWNPLAWAAARAWRTTQEQAADDLVLRCGGSAQDYAMLLLEAARSCHEGRIPRGPVLAMARSSSLEARLSAIMDADRNRRHASRQNLSAAAVCALLVMGGVGSISLQGQPAKADEAAAEPAKPTKKQVGTIVKVLKAPAGHFTSNLRISSGMLLTSLEAEEMLKAPGVSSESTPRVVTWDRQKVVIENAIDEEESHFLAGQKITLLPAIDGASVHVDVEFSIPEEAAKSGGLAAMGSRTLSAPVDVPEGLTAVLVLPAVERQPDILLQVTPVVLAPPPPWFSAEEKASKIRLPEVRLSNVSIDEAVDWLRVKAAELTPDHKGINLLNVGQPEARLSLDLKEVSLKEALSSVAKSANMDIQYDPYAAVLSPRGFLRPSVGLKADSEITMVAAKASSISLPQMDFHQTALEDVVSCMRKEVSQAEPEQIRFDIALNDKSPAARKLISIHLQDISMLEMLHYIAVLGDYTLMPEGRAFVLTPAAK